MFEEEKCPICGSTEYDTEDYCEEFDYTAARQWWECKCAKCEQIFTIERTYNLKSVEVSAD